MSDGNQAPVRFEGSQPILRVEDMQASLRFYVDLLGFKNQPWGTEEFTSVNRDRAGIYLCRGGQGAGRAWIWIGVEDVESCKRNIRLAVWRSACRRRTSPGRLRCTSKILTAM